MEPHDFWQDIHPPGSLPTDGPFERFYPATLADGRQLKLPIRALVDGDHGLASLIINQASFAVQDLLATLLANQLLRFSPDVVVGLPTLGLTLAAPIARALGHSRYVPLGTSRKFWYDEQLSVPLSSITTPEQVKRLYVDPRMLPLLRECRVALIDDVASSGASMAAGLALLRGLRIEPVVLGVAMAQTNAWKARLDGTAPASASKLVSVFSTPKLRKTAEGGWMPLD